MRILVKKNNDLIKIYSTEIMKTYYLPANTGSGPCGFCSSPPPKKFILGW